MPTGKKIENWEDKFDKFISDNEVRWEGSNVRDVKYTAIPQLKFFIFNLLQEEKNKLMEEMRGIGCIGCHKKNLYELEQLKFKE